MSLSEIKENLIQPLKQATLCFLVDGDEVLLAMKKRGFGMGKWNGVGGKVGENETIEEAASRETLEEVGVTPKTLKRLATINFYFPSPTHPGQQVFVFLVEDWEGEPEESEEMAPKWFKFTEIPYDTMWQDDIHWLPLVLAGKTMEAEFLFDENDQLLEHETKIT